MKSGIHDYKDEQMSAWSILNPDKDFTPFDFLWNVTKEWYCKPGKCEVYSSVGYTILGLALAQNARVERWQDYDFMTIIPEHLRPKYKDMHWAREGKCS